MTGTTGDWGLLPGGPASRALGVPTESREKLTSLRAAMGEADVDAVYLEDWANVAWLCGGRGNRVVLDEPTGLCGILVGHNGAWLLVANNEEARCRAEAFRGLDLPVIVQPWYRMPLFLASRPLLPPGAVIIADVAVDGEQPGAAALLSKLRARLGEAEMERYRALGQDAATALEAAVTEARPTWTELEVAGTIAAALKAYDIEGKVILVGNLERAETFRHFVPTGAGVDRGFVASITATRHGLHASCTRTIAFQAPPPLLAERLEVVLDVDRVYLTGSRPGARLDQLLDAGARTYARHGFYDEWKEHHQGGTTGYGGRESFAIPGNDYVLEAGNAVAWNPTVPGAKSEDTFAVHAAGLEWLTRAPGSEWPLDEGDGKLPRPRLNVL
ncbi:MAG: M24 family metallopeptidase [Candidatus Dormibacteria bacterium]